MNNKTRLLKMVVLSMLIALGVVISPILRFEGMCPMAHLINIVCSVSLGPWYSLLCATLIGIIRMITMGIPPIALTGAIFGAFLSGVAYRLSNGKLIFAVLGEVIGTGIIGAILSYPVMSIFWGKEDIPVKKDDHSLDELRYYIMQKPQPPKVQTSKSEIQKDKEKLQRRINFKNKNMNIKISKNLL